MIRIFGFTFTCRQILHFPLFLRKQPKVHYFPESNAFVDNVSKRQTRTYSGLEFGVSVAVSKFKRF